MNEKWDKIKDQLLKLQLPQEGIDPTALADEQNMWSVYAEEMGYGF